MLILKTVITEFEVRLGNNFFKITEFNCNFVVKMIYCGNLHDQAEREKDRKEKLKKFEDWQKVKKEKGEVRTTTTTSTPFELMHDFAKLQKEH